ncbi:MAG: hypothetical protein K2X74_17085 [Acetobacteraceae bacterium]|nr:hypothetical protein [Acetobacteraceae bacterium]
MVELPKLGIVIPSPPAALAKSPPVRTLKRSNAYFAPSQFRKEGPADGDRQSWFYQQLKRVADSVSSSCLPFAFIDAAETAYVLDRGAVKFAVNKGFLEPLQDFNGGGVRLVVLTPKFHAMMSADAQLHANPP